MIISRPFQINEYHILNIKNQETIDQLERSVHNISASKVDI